MSGYVAGGVVAVVVIGLNLYTFWKARRAEATYPPLGQFVIVEGIRLHYIRKGSGPPVVLLHGSDGFLQDYTFALLDRLTPQYDVLALDRPGHGYSDAPRGEAATPIVQARLIRGALRQLGIDKSVLVGHSWSGALLMVYALEYPDEVSGLVLLGAWVYASEAPPSLLLTLAQIPILGMLSASTLLAPIKNLIIRCNLAKAFAPDPVPGEYARMAEALWQRRPYQTKVFAQENTTDMPVLRAISPRYSEIGIPVVIVTGDADSIVAPAQHACRLHAAIPHSELMTLPKTGHELPQTRPEAVAEAIYLCWERASELPSAKAQADSSARERGCQDTAYRRARELVFRYGWNAASYQILNPDMEYWFSADGEAVVGFVTRRKVRVVAGVPICAANRIATITSEFEQVAAQEGERVCYFGAAARLQSVVTALPGHSAIIIGAQPAWNPAHWSGILAQNASLRAQLNRARNKGVRVSEWPMGRAHNHPGLQRCMEEWLAARPLPPLRFLTEPLTLDRLADRRIFVAESQEEPAGFLIVTPIPDRNGWLVEQIVRAAKAPNGTAERLVDTAMQTLAAEGYDYITLGLAPLSQRVRLTTQPPVPWLRWLLLWIRAHGRRFYNFDGLDAFKAKFKPDAWEPISAISNEPRFSFSTLYAIAAAFSETPPAAMVLHALAAAVRQELAWLWKRARRRPA